MSFLRCAALFCACALLIPVPSAGQTLDEVIAKNLAAKGGVELLRATTSARLRATVELPSGRPGAGPVTMRITVSTKRPNLVRRDMVVGAEERSLGFDGKEAWQAGPEGEALLSGPPADAIRSEGEFDSVLLTYREQGHSVDLAGQEEIDGRKVHRLRIRRKDGPVQTYYLDAATGLEHKVVTEVEAGGQRITSEMRLSDYRTVDGRTMPFKATQFVNGELAADITFEEIEFNVPLEDAFFRMPRKRGRPGAPPPHARPPSAARRE